MISGVKNIFGCTPFWNSFPETGIDETVSNYFLDLGILFMVNALSPTIFIDFDNLPNIFNETSTSTYPL